MVLNKNEIICYESDASRMKGVLKKVVFPENSEDVKKIILANDSIVPRGSGSNIVGGCVPNGSVVVDMKKMNKVKNLDFPKKTVYVEAGVTIKELNEKLNSVGFEFPVFVNEFSTIGGLIALNPYGENGKYGLVKNWIEEIEFVSGRGEILKLGVADLTDVCGKEGTTGIITHAKLKIIPLTEKSASIFQSDNFEEIWSISRRLKLENDVISLKLFSPLVSKFLGFPKKYHIIIIFDSDKGKIRKGDFIKLKYKTKKDYFYLLSRGYYNFEDAKVFFEKIPELISLLYEIPYIGDLINGIIYIFSNDNDKKIVSDLIERINGKPCRYGFGMKRVLENIDRKIIYRIKLRYDPLGKINKGKLFGLDIKEVKKISRTVEKELEVFDKAGLPKEKLEEDFKKIEIVPKNRESPEDKMNRLIAEAKNAEEKEIRKKLIDYEKTFMAVEGKNKARVEKFAKEIPRDIIKSERTRADFGQEPYLDLTKIRDNLDRPSSSNFIKGKVSEHEKDLINSIMTNKFGFSNSEKKKTEENKIKENFRREQNGS